MIPIATTLRGLVIAAAAGLLLAASVASAQTTIPGGAGPSIHPGHSAPVPPAVPALTVRPNLPPPLIDTLTTVPQYHQLLETDCQWTNDNVAQCIVWDCDSDGVCTEYGDYCVDRYGNVVPCP